MNDKATEKYSSGDWLEDFAGEDGNYWHECIACKGMFIGHKRRQVCRRCSTESSGGTDYQQTKGKPAADLSRAAGPDTEWADLWTKKPAAAGPDTAPTPRDVFVQMLQDQVQILKDSLAERERRIAELEHDMTRQVAIATEHINERATLTAQLAAETEAREANDKALNAFMKSMARCENCAGSGLIDNHVTGEIECSLCNGTGWSSELVLQLAEVQDELADIKRELSAAESRAATMFERTRGVLADARNYILNKAQRHDLNWRDGHNIIERINALTHR
ncbi:MAG: hypothetical protein U1A72_08950 [Sulfuritalea sp.]|nr:hypothetical protein [Sulfuritalea sp.]